jgi:hypothetical protein
MPGFLTVYCFDYTVYFGDASCVWINSNKRIYDFVSVVDDFDNSLVEYVL